MRKFIVTIEGKSYEVGVEEVGAEQSTSVVKQTVAAPAPAQQPAAAAAPASGEKLLSPFPGLIKSSS